MPTIPVPLTSELSAMLADRWQANPKSFGLDLLSWIELTHRLRRQATSRSPLASANANATRDIWPPRPILKTPDRSWRIWRWRCQRAI
jgi:hypothetical protein